MAENINPFGAETATQEGSCRRSNRRRHQICRNNKLGMVCGNIEYRHDMGQGNIHDCLVEYDHEGARYGNQ